MNFYNPYYFVPTRPSLFASLRNSFNLSGILNGTQRTLNLINQAIPIVKQVSPMMKNARTMFRVMNEFKKVDTPNVSKNNKQLNNTQSISENAANEEGPRFFA